MPFLYNRHTYLAIEDDEMKAYADEGLADLTVRVQADGPRIVRISNPEGSVAVARELLRALVTRLNYDWYVLTDDNARFTEASLLALVRSADLYQKAANAVVFMAGFHSTASHFDRHAIARSREEVHGYLTYRAPGFIFHAVPHAWYENYSYPEGCFALEDRHMMFAAIRAGIREFRVCMDAPFSKKRYEPGGQGDIQKRRWNCGRAIEQLAHDFPEYMGVRGTWTTPWQAIFQYADGADLTRLVGGAMRKGDQLEKQLVVASTGEHGRQKRSVTRGEIK